MSDKVFRAVQIVLFIIVVIVFCFSLYKVVTITMEYKASREEYKELQEYAKVESEPEIPEATAPTKPEGKDDQTAAAESKKEIIMRYHDSFVNMDVDFQALEAENPDFTGWLYIPGVAISYPMVLGSDNDYYLTHTFRREENKSGAIFLDQVTTNPFEGYNTIVHGHNMKDVSMFGRLKYFYNDTQIYANNPYFYIYTAEKSYKYLICSYYVTTVTSDTYIIPNTEEMYQKYKNKILKNAVYQGVEGIPESAPIVTLSTCHGATYTDQRLVVHGILVATQ